MSPMTATLKSYTLQVQGMNCVKCIRKVQSVAHKFESLKKLNVNLSAQLVTFKAPPAFPVMSFVSEIRGQGFQVKILDAQASTKTTHFKKSLKQLGVAGACSGNIMMFSAAKYSGAFEWNELFTVFEGAFFIPVLLYSSSTLIKTTWSSLKIGKVSIDAPIVLALLGGAVLSYWNLIAKNEGVYFDSLSMFIFFLLSSRYIVQSIQSKFLAPVSLEDVYYQTEALVLKEGREVETPVSEVKVGDRLKISKNTYLCCDAVLKSSNAYIDDAFFTGESLPQKIQEESPLRAGSRNVGPAFEVEVTATKENSRLSSMVERLNTSLEIQTPFFSKIDQGAGALTGLIVLSSVLLFAYFSFYDFQEGVQRVLALLVVACPCGLAIAAPLVQTLTLKKALKESLIVKDVSVLEKLSQIKKAFFDKTGTLTKGELKVEKWLPQEPNEFEKRVIYTLEKQSEHPVAVVLRRSVGEQKLLPMKNYKEEIGVGVSATIGGVAYSLQTSDDDFGQVTLIEEGKKRLTILLNDSEYESSHRVIDYLKKKNIHPYVITGDKEDKAFDLAEKVGVSKDFVFSQKLPEEKAELVEKESDPVLYIGDGVNDSLAMSKSQVSVSMSSSADLAFKSSQVHILKGGPEKLIYLFELSQLSFQSIKVIVVVSLLYNVFFAALAAAGFIHPLVAVIIMPLSSITVTLLGVFLMNKKILVEEVS